MSSAATCDAQVGHSYIGSIRAARQPLCGGDSAAYSCHRCRPGLPLLVVPREADDARARVAPLGLSVADADAARDGGVHASAAASKRLAAAPATVPTASAC